MSQFERTKLKMVWENALRKLKRQIEKTNEHPDTLDRSKNELAVKWENLLDCHVKHIEQMTEGAEKEEENDKFSELSEKHEVVMESADEKIKDAKEAKDIVERDVLANRDDTEVEKKRQTFETRLGSIVVSKKSQNAFMTQLIEMKVENWSEKSQCKVVYGIDPDFYKAEFIGKDGEKGLFQTASGVDDETMASFKMVSGSGGMNDQLKTFSSKPEKSGNKIAGKFGMYSASRRADGEKANLIDVAYVVYDFEADLMGDASDKWLDAGVADNSPNPSKAQESLMTRLKVGDVAALTENFILSKALTAFAQSNVIKKVKWEEEEEEEEEEEGGRLHDVTDDDKVTQVK